MEDKFLIGLIVVALGSSMYYVISSNNKYEKKYYDEQQKHEAEETRKRAFGEDTTNDVCLSKEIMDTCISTRGPERITMSSNDWAEALEQCRITANSLSTRQRRYISKECLS